MNQHLRKVALVGALSVILAACGGGDGAAPSVGEVAAVDPTSATTVPAASQSSDPASGSVPGDDAPAGAATSDPSAPLAPDFALALDGGGEFVLSEEAMPVYMVFWAEW